MQPRYDLMRYFLLTLNVVLVMFAAILCYLLFGHSISESYQEYVHAREIRSHYDQRRYSAANTPDDADKIVNGIHLETGFVYDQGFELVRGTCTACHSAKLVTQNRATREGWQEMIRWMQAKQGLWDLGKNEGPILDYLAKHYAPEEVGRRAKLDVEGIEWYVLELDEGDK